MVGSCQTCRVRRPGHLPPTAALLTVAHTQRGLEDLAVAARARSSAKIVAVTGSAGKTTTKELVHAVLNSHYTTYTTVGNLNNHIGIPLTLLRIQEDAEMAVVEMGANHQKEIELLSSIAQPSHGLITNVGKAHLEGFGGVEGVKKGKGKERNFFF